MKKDTYFIDIDGTLVDYVPFDELSYDKTEPTPNAVEFVTQLKSEGHKIVLTTARPETKRVFTEKQMKMIGIPYDQLVMGLGRGIRYLINDIHPDNPNKDRAVGINVERNKGFNI